MASLLKILAGAFFLVPAFPLALIAGFGRFKTLYLMGAHIVAGAPGLPGDYLRVAYYRLVLRSCSPRCRVSFGAIFSNPDATVGEGVYIGPYSVFGRVRIGRNTQIATHVQVLSGARQHGRDAAGNILGSEEGAFVPVSIGAQAWLGAGAIVMADVGDRTTIGAGAVVTKDVPADVVAVGNPARVIRAAVAQPLAGDVRP